MSPKEYVSAINTVLLYSYHLCMIIIYSESMDHPSKVTNPARGQLNRVNMYFIFACPRLRLRIWSQEMDSAVRFRVCLLILHTQAECGARFLPISPPASVYL